MADTLRRNRRNCKIGANSNTGSLAVRLLAVGGQAVLMLDGIVDPKLDSSASHPSPSSHSLSRRVICHHGDSVPTIMGGLVLWLQCAASFTRRL